MALYFSYGKTSAPKATRDYRPRSSTFLGLQRDFIIKIANADATFESLCKKEEYNSLWANQYSLMGYTLTSDNEVSINLLPNKHNNFDLLRGAYFFHKSQVARKELGKKFYLEERSFLDKAIQYDSVHAIQEYNNYIYMELNNEENELDDEEKISLIKKTIENCTSVSLPR